MARTLPSKPGWYTNAMDRSSMQYWDGGRWTARYRPRPPWLSQLADLEPSTEAYDRAIEGPVHPHELRAPVTSGASSREGPSLWRAWQSQRHWHRPSPWPSLPDVPGTAPPSTKFAAAGRPLAFFLVMILVGVAVVVSSFAVMAPYERGGVPHPTIQAADTSFVDQASRDCAAVLPRYRAALWSGVDGPTVMTATRELDRLRLRLAGLHPAAGIQGPVDAWLAYWEQYEVWQRHYANIVGPAVGAESGVALRPLSTSAQASAEQARRNAAAEARLADHDTSDLRIAACSLEPGSQD